MAGFGHGTIAPHECQSPDGWNYGTIGDADTASTLEPGLSLDGGGAGLRGYQTQYTGEGHLPCCWKIHQAHKTRPRLLLSTTAPRRNPEAAKWRNTGLEGTAQGEQARKEPVPHEAMEMAADNTGTTKNAGLSIGWSGCTQDKARNQHARWPGSRVVGKTTTRTLKQKARMKTNVKRYLVLSCKNKQGMRA